jgi:hypothetical protein
LAIFGYSLQAFPSLYENFSLEKLQSTLKSEFCEDFSSGNCNNTERIIKTMNGKERKIRLLGWFNSFSFG